MNLPKNLPSPMGMTKKEIVNLLLKGEYGTLPSAPISVKYHVEEEDKRYCAGKAIYQKLRIICDTEYGLFSFPVHFAFPTKTDEPSPCFIQINFRNAIPDNYLPTEEIIDNGFAVLSLCYLDIASDDKKFDSKLAGLVYPEGQRKPHQCGKIGLWAWAVMRVMDIAVTLPQLNPDRISICGHSRLGKTALLAGALDERFYCAFSNNSGCSGAALSREKEGETIADIYERFPFWFCEHFQKYVNNEDQLPFDQHFLIAANLPHRVYVASAVEDLWADPKNEYLSCIAASEYYKENCGEGFSHPERLPEVGEQFADGMIGYHLRKGKHYFSREDWNFYFEYLKKHQ